VSDPKRGPVRWMTSECPSCGCDVTHDAEETEVTCPDCEAMFSVAHPASEDASRPASGSGD
jgi:hypothetical protein